MGKELKQYLVAFSDVRYALRERAYCLLLSKCTLPFIAE